MINLSTVKNWFINRGDNQFASLCKKKIPGLEPLGIAWPEYSHLFLNLPAGNTFFGYVSLYGNTGLQIIFTTNVSSMLGNKIHGGLICDC